MACLQTAMLVALNLLVQQSHGNAWIQLVMHFFVSFCTIEACVQLEFRRLIKLSILPKLCKKNKRNLKFACFEVGLADVPSVPHSLAEKSTKTLPFVSSRMNDLRF